jgi:hypothetical protein
LSVPIIQSRAVHFSGLDTDPAGACCGMRPRWEAMLPLLQIPGLLVIAYDDPERGPKLRDAAAGTDALYVSGHSHGAAEAWKLLNGGAVARCAVAVFMDLAPRGDPLSWRGGFWSTPPVCERGLWFWQRNDAPLAGVRGQASPTTEAYDVSGWGLHHSSMCDDDRVWAHIKDMVLWDHIQRVRRRLAEQGQG